MLNTIPEARRNRGGKHVLPPNPQWWECEHHGLDLRRDLGLAYEAPLEVSAAFARIPDTIVVPHGELPAAAVFLEHYRGEASGNWSGFALPLSDGAHLVVYNDSHPDTRVRATLMEEYFHLKLGHPVSVIRELSNGDRLRTINTENERVAYGSGAAALVPFHTLREWVLAAVHTSEIARRLGVSSDLVKYRMSVTKLWSKRRSK